MFDNNTILTIDVTRSFGKTFTKMALEKYSPVKIIIPFFRSLKDQGKLSVADESKKVPGNFIYTSPKNTDGISIQELHHCIEHNMEIL